MSSGRGGPHRGTAPLEDPGAHRPFRRRHRPREELGAESRTWWVDGRCVLVGPHPDAVDSDVPDLMGVAPLVAGLGQPFVIVDLARGADGRWRVVELGDGQVSDRPATIAPTTLLGALRARA